MTFYFLIKLKGLLSEIDYLAETIYFLLWNLEVPVFFDELLVI